MYITACSHAICQKEKASLVRKGMHSSWGIQSAVCGGSWLGWAVRDCVSLNGSEHVE